MHEDIPIYDNHVPKEFVMEDGEFKGVKFDKVEAVYDENGASTISATLGGLTGRLSLDARSIPSAMRPLSIPTICTPRRSTPKL